MNNKFGILKPQFDKVSDLGNCMWFMDLFTRRNFTNIDTVLLHKRHIPLLLEHLKKMGAEILDGQKFGIVVNLSLEKIDFVCVVWKHSIVSNKCNFTIATNGTLDDLVKFGASLPIESTDSNGIDVYYYFMSVKNGFCSSDIYVDTSEFRKIYTELYPDIDINELITQYNEAHEPILMLYGDPGLGKTTFIKHILNVGGYNKVAYVKDPKVMEEGEFWSELTSRTFDALIFDDLDIGLLPRRKNENSTFMTQLLSFSDGIFTQGKMKIIITTNQAVKEIDSALVRPGRCFDFIKLNPLERKDALSFWTEILKLDAKGFDAVFGNAQIITQASLMSEAHRQAAVGVRSYIKRGSNTYTLDDKLQSLGIQTSDGEGRKASF